LRDVFGVCRKFPFTARLQLLATRSNTSSKRPPLFFCLTDCLEELSLDMERTTYETLIISLAFPSMSSSTLNKQTH
jgi:hypothetical protein